MIELKTKHKKLGPVSTISEAKAREELGRRISRTRTQPVPTASLRANIAETLLVSLITEQGGKEIQHEEHEDILSGPVGRVQ
jgi:hypothetical protein